MPLLNDAFCICILGPTHTYIGFLPKGPRARILFSVRIVDKFVWYINMLVQLMAKTHDYNIVYIDRKCFRNVIEFWIFLCNILVDVLHFYYISENLHTPSALHPHCFVHFLVKITQQYAYVFIFIWFTSNVIEIMQNCAYFWERDQDHGLRSHWFHCLGLFAVPRSSIRQQVHSQNWTGSHTRLVKSIWINQGQSIFCL